VILISGGIFCMSSWIGINNGLQRLSKMVGWGAFLLPLVVLLIGPTEIRITNAWTVKLSGSPVRADRPRVKVAAVTTSEMVNAFPGSFRRSPASIRRAFGAAWSI
jgi:hypothetical protein